MPYHVDFEEWVPFPVERVFLFFANPTNLPRIMPPSTRTRIDGLRLVPPPLPLGVKNLAVGSLAGVGSEIVTSFCPIPFFPVRTAWIARITEFEWNSYFEDVQAKGPFRNWRQRHEMRPGTRNGVEGTTVCDRITLDLGFGMAGDAASRLFLAKQIANTFKFRQKVLPSLLAK
ncbi:MAG TPA: SRPBCC family protein [Terriglobales bacterium]|nr:SRPBCC family protein [Terriglobales bacterium]